MAANDYDAWKRQLNLKELPVATLRGVELITRERYDKSTYQDYYEQVDYPDKPIPARYVCKCGSAQFTVYCVQDYETRVRCITCNNDHCIHSG